MKFKYAIITFIFSIFFLCGVGVCEEVQDIQLELRNTQSILIPAGIVIPAINMQEISTETCPEGYKVKFVTTNDL